MEGALDDALFTLVLERLALELEDTRVEDTCAEVGYLDGLEKLAGS